MHFSCATVIAAIASFGMVLQVDGMVISARNNKTPVGAVVNNLDTNGQLNWTETENGGNMVFLSDETIQSVHGNLNTTTAMTKRTSWGDWTSLGRHGGTQASSQCITSGAWGLSGVLSSYATKACSDIVANTALGAAGNKGWQIWQGATSKDVYDDADSGESTTTFRFRSHGANPPKLTDEVCDWAFDQLTTVACQGFGPYSGATHGGEIMYGTDDDSGALHFGMDPNED